MSSSSLRYASFFFVVVLSVFILGAAAQDNSSTATQGSSSPPSVTMAPSSPLSGASGASPAAPTSPAAISPAASGTIQLGQIEAQQRAQVNTSGFSTNFATLTNSGGDYADARYVLGQTSPALFTLPGDGLAQGVITLKACALWSPHYHPRASEVIYVTSGTVNVSFSEENPVVVNGRSYGGNIYNYTLSAGSNVVIPQALIHFVYNPSCDNATVITSYNNRDPGAVSITQGLFNLDSTIVQAATGLQSQLQETARAVTAKTPIIGIDLTCQQKCPQTPSAQSAGRRHM